ncbi:MAG: hypothetical protein ETSY1_22425 [Candidatus Entotheonella factor]|uniref:Cytochrome c domain-containing protein n=1 Tax=Entotheonella factor TaxID=1429438 RepID=W4LHN0_ENTF1|nr:hypothetical protein [Candidatus Entotheonella palauensis]ETW97492.1 MAG: hypothetical protein ETSY1_22425 [Candidatus Entotheonella factor]
MAPWRQISVMASLLLLLLLPAIVQTQPAGSAPADGLRPTMRGIFQALTTVIPLSLSKERFQDAANRQRLHDALLALSNHAMKLTQHGQRAPAGFDFLRRSLQDDARNVFELFESESFEESRFILHHLVDHCFLCHSRLPSSQPFPLGKRFLEQIPLKQLDPHERMRLAVATRQFDTALASCETIFRSLDLPAAQIDLMALFEDYLRIAIRVQGDFPRVIRTLETFQRRPDVPTYLADHLSAWIEALTILQADREQNDELTQARALIQQGQQLNRYLADRQGLVHFTLASSLLHRFAESRSASKLKLAEAYYLLGVAGSYMPRTSWISETEFYLETAVRLAPASSIGKQAFVFLEAYLIMGYSGSSGLHFPPDIHHRLEELRAFVKSHSIEK